VERSPGIATSLEVSTAPEPLTNVRNVFATYPHWLAKPSVTFEILEAKPNPNGSTTIQLRGTDLDILTFGRHVSLGKNSILLPILTSGLLALLNPLRVWGDYGALSFTMKTKQILETRIERRGYRPAIGGNPPVSREERGPTDQHSHSFMPTSCGASTRIAMMLPPALLLSSMELLDD
jgi:hypothetical protein